MLCHRRRIGDIIVIHPAPPPPFICPAHFSLFFVFFFLLGHQIFLSYSSIHRPQLFVLTRPISRVFRGFSLSLSPRADGVRNFEEYFSPKKWRKSLTGNVGWVGFRTVMFAFKDGLSRDIHPDFCLTFFLLPPTFDIDLCA